MKTAVQIRFDAITELRSATRALDEAISAKVDNSTLRAAAERWQAARSNGRVLGIELDY